MLSKTSARIAAGVTCLFLIAMPVSAQLGAPGVPAVPGVPAAPELPGVPGVPGVPAAPDLGTVDADTIAGSASVSQHGADVCADASTLHGTATGAADMARSQADAAATPAMAAAEGAKQQVEAATSDVTDQLPLMSTQDLPDATELGLEHCASVSVDDPTGAAGQAQDKASGFLGTLQGWVSKATSWLPF